ESIEIELLEIVRVLREHPQVCHAVPADSGGEDPAARERRQHRPPAGGAAADRDAGRVGAAGLSQTASGGQNIIDVDNAPLPVEPLAIVAAVAGRPAVVDVEHADSSAGVEGDRS